MVRIRKVYLFIKAVYDLFLLVFKETVIHKDGCKDIK